MIEFLEMLLYSIVVGIFTILAIPIIAIGIILLPIFILIGIAVDVFTNKNI